MDHSIFSPSQVDSWKFSACPAYLFHQDYDRKSNEIMARGTAVHSLSENKLKNGLDIQAELGRRYDIDGFIIEVDENMIETAEFYCAEVNNIKKENPEADFFIEHRVSLEAYGYPEVFGTSDTVIKEIFGNLVILDLKSGKGKYSADSGQVKFYAIMTAGNMLDTYEKIETIIVQPNDIHGEKIKKAVHDPEELHAWLIEEVIPSVEAYKRGEKIYHPSENACRWCDFKGKCKAQAEFSLSLLTGNSGEMDFDELLNADYAVPGVLSNQEISYVLENESFIKQWIESVRTVALEKLLNLQSIPNYKLVESITKSIWHPEKDVDHILRKELKIRKKDIYTEKLKSPTAIKELLKKKPDLLKRVEELITRPSGRPTIAPVSDRRSDFSSNIITPEKIMEFI